MIAALFWCAYTARGTSEYLPITRSLFAVELSQCLGKIAGNMADVNSMVSDDLIKNVLFMPRLVICSRDLHWHWINRTLLCETMEVSVLRRAWLAIAQHVFQSALTGRPELISWKIVSSEPGTKAFAVSRFREKLSPANWVQTVTAILRKILRSWAPKNGVQHATVIYPIPRYTRPRYIGCTLYSYLLGTLFVVALLNKWRRVYVSFQAATRLRQHTSSWNRQEIYHHHKFIYFIVAW